MDMRTFRHIQIHQFFHRHAIGKVVARRVHVIKTVAHHFGFEIGLGFHVLLDARVQIADIRNAVDNCLAIELKQQTQHPMRGRMLRPHVQQHGLAGQSTF